MHVAVLGGGFQGCCVALALAARGARVTIFDRQPDLMTRAAIANEGKIHLGYMYGGDPSLSTARMMMRGALAFAPFLSNRLAVDVRGLELSDPALYVVHRDSQRPLESIAKYLSAVHALIQEAAAEESASYFGIDLAAPIRRWTAAEMESCFNNDQVQAVFASPEVAIDPVAVASLVRKTIAETPSIDLCLEHAVTGVARDQGIAVVSRDPEGRDRRDRFDHVVNCLWDGRLAIDATLGQQPRRPWLHRLKYGVSLRPSPAVPPLLSMTVILGPFGELVRYGNGTIYLTWYPDCVRALTSALAPPDWPIFPPGPLSSEIFRGTFSALAGIQPALRDIAEHASSDIQVRGGPIVAWGKTDIDDPASELHRRFEIGVTSIDRYHSIDPGKLTMAPYFADECAQRIMGTVGRVAHPLSSSRARAS